MWNKLVFGGLAAAVLTACGPSVSEAVPQEEQAPDQMTENKVKNPQAAEYQKLIEVGEMIGTAYSGFLPEMIPAQLIPIQTRIAETLKSGLPLDVFADARLKPENSIGSLGSRNGSRSSVTRIDGKYQMHLVARNIQAISESAVLSCDSGGLYRAYISAKPYVQSFSQGESATIEFTVPYELHFCETSEGITYALAAEDEAVRTELGIGAFGEMGE